MVGIVIVPNMATMSHTNARWLADWTIHDDDGRPPLHRPRGISSKCLRSGLIKVWKAAHAGVSSICYPQGKVLSLVP